MCVHLHKINDFKLFYTYDISYLEEENNIIYPTIWEAWPIFLMIYESCIWLRNHLTPPRATVIIFSLMKLLQLRLSLDLHITLMTFLFSL